MQRVAEAIFQRDCSINTHKAFASDMRHYLGWFQGKNGYSFSFQKASPRDVSDYKIDQQHEAFAPATINRRLINVRLFYKTAVNLGIITSNPAEGVKHVGNQRLAPKGLTSQEARQLLKEVELRKNVRDLLIIQLMLSAGLRCGEVVALKLQDVEISERKGALVVRKGKGDKQRTVPLNQNLREILAEYIKQYQPTDSLILGQRGAITQVAINKLVTKYGKKAGLKLHPHMLRHSYARAFMDKHRDVVSLAQILGHQNISTTQIYTQNRLEDLQEKAEAVSF